MGNKNGKKSKAVDSMALNEDFEARVRTTRPHLTAENIKYLRALFLHHADTEKRLNMDRLYTLLRELPFGTVKIALSYAVISNVLDIFDSSKRRRIDFWDFLRVTRLWYHPTREEKVETQFAIWDLNANGFLEKAEIDAALMWGMDRELTSALEGMQPPVDLQTFSKATSGCRFTRYALSVLQGSRLCAYSKTPQYVEPEESKAARAAAGGDFSTAVGELSMAMGAAAAAAPRGAGAAAGGSGGAAAAAAAGGSGSGGSSSSSSNPVMSFHCAVRDSTSSSDLVRAMKALAAFSCTAAGYATVSPRAGVVIASCTNRKRELDARGSDLWTHDVSRAYGILLRIIKGGGSAPELATGQTLIDTIVVVDDARRGVVSNSGKQLLRHALEG